MQTIYQLLGRPVIAKPFRFKKGLHRLFPRRLTLRLPDRPAIYGWLWWNFGWNNEP